MHKIRIVRLQGFRHRSLRQSQRIVRPKGFRNRSLREKLNIRNGSIRERIVRHQKK